MGINLKFTKPNKIIIAQNMPYSQTSATAHETSKKQGQNKIYGK
jgi:hypothetical protein